MHTKQIFLLKIMICYLVHVAVDLHANYIQFSKSHHQYTLQRNLNTKSTENQKYIFIYIINQMDFNKHIYETWYKKEYLSIPRMQDDQQESKTNLKKSYHCQALNKY